MSVSRRWTVAELEQIEPVDGQRYEVIDGELYVTHAPSWRHQFVSSRLGTVLTNWSDETSTGLCIPAPGVIFNFENAVIPDLVWISFERMRRGTDQAGHFTLAPELAIEILSPGSSNERRDRETKLALYSREGVDEYWIVDWQQRTIDVYRRTGNALRLNETYGADGVIESPILPGFQLQIARIWPPSL